MRSISRGLIVFLLALSFVRAIPAAEKREITEKDLFQFIWIVDP